MQLTEHFGTTETDWYRIPLHYRSNALATLALVERYRTLWGNQKVYVTSFWRSEQENAAVGGSPSSQHLDATGIDVKVPSLAYDEAVRRVLFAPEILQITGEFVYYDTRSHFHITLPTRGEIGQVLRKHSEGYAVVHSGQGYPTLIRSLPESGRVTLAALAIGGLIVFS